MTFRLAALVSLSSLLLTPATAHTLKVTGKVVNATTDNPAPPGLEVQVDVVGPQGDKIDSASARLGGGSFSVKVEVGNEDRVVASTTYKGVTYSSVGSSSVVQESDVRIGVFEPTHDDGVLSVLSDTTILAPDDSGEIEALQLVRLNNDSKRTFVGTEDGRFVYRLPLPQDAYSVRIVEGITPGRSRNIDEGLEVGDPVQPGDISISFAYKLPGTEDGWNLDHRLTLPTRRLDLLLEPDLSVSGSALKSLGRIDFRGRAYHQYSITNLDAGDDLRAEVRASLGTGVWPVAAGIGAVVLVTVLVWVSARRRARTRSARRSLVQGIARLDVEREAGKVSDDEYQARRSALKKDLGRIGKRSS